MHFEIRLTPAELRRGIAVRSASDGEAEQLTCDGCESEAEESVSEGAEDADGRSRWGLYDQPPPGWGGAKAGHD
jgi:hypothetical protein